MNASVTNEQAVQDLYQAWNSRDLHGWVTAFHPEAVWINVPTGEEFTGPEGMEQNYTNWDVPFPDGQCTNIQVYAGETFAVGRFLAAGQNKGPLSTPDGEIPPTGKEIAVMFCDVHELQDGKITSTYRYWDQATVNRALGLG